MSFVQGKAAMPKCTRCQTETELYENDSPICINCANQRTEPKPKPPARLRDRLFRDLVDATARVSADLRNFDELMDQLPSMHSATRIKNASESLDVSRKELTRAHNRLN